MKPELIRVSVLFVLSIGAAEAKSVGNILFVPGAEGRAPTPLVNESTWWMRASDTRDSAPPSAELVRSCAAAAEVMNTRLRSLSPETKATLSTRVVLLSVVQGAAYDSSPDLPEVLREYRYTADYGCALNVVDPAGELKITSGKKSSWRRIRARAQTAYRNEQVIAFGAKQPYSIFGRAKPITLKLAR